MDRRSVRPDDEIVPSFFHVRVEYFLILQDDDQFERSAAFYVDIAGFLFGFAFVADEINHEITELEMPETVLFHLGDSPCNRLFRDVDLESEQKLWRWALVGLLAVALIEIWLAGWLSRSAPTAGGQQE